jgi:Fungal N-terminal domain of STAND proteins
MEVLSLTASVVGIIQIADRIAGVCISYIDSVKDYPKDLRRIYVEVTSLKVVFQSLRFLDEDDAEDSTALQTLRDHDGPVIECKKAMADLSELLPRAEPQISRKGAKRQKINKALATLAWPLKADRARKLLDDIIQYKLTISVALTGELL